MLDTVRRNSQMNPDTVSSTMASLHFPDGAIIPNVATSPAVLSNNTNGLMSNGKSKAGSNQIMEETESLSINSQSNGDLPIPPDGGWGWFVVFASFMIHVVGKLSLVNLRKFNKLMIFSLHFSRWHYILIWDFCGGTYESV